MNRKLKNIIYGLAVIGGVVTVPAGCIHNDLPYPRIPQNITAITAVGESKSAYIDSIAFEVNLYL